MAESTSNRRGKKSKQQKNHRDFEHEDDLTQEAGSLAGTAERVTDYVAEGVGEIRDRIRTTTEGREGTIVVVALAVGFGLGIALGSSLGAQQRRSRGWSDRMACESVGRRMLERLEDMLPQSLSEYIRR